VGAAGGLSHVVFVAVGTGIGAGVLAHGRPLEGAHGIAGAAGWMTLSRRWRVEYARCGCWEVEAAGPGAAARGGFPDGEAMARAALAGDGRARRAMERAARWPGAGIANLVRLFDPEMVVLGGSFGLSPALPLPVVEEEMRRWAQPVSFARVRLQRSQLGPAAALLGAARLALTAPEGDSLIWHLRRQFIDSKWSPMITGARRNSGTASCRRPSLCCSAAIPRTPEPGIHARRHKPGSATDVAGARGTA
jgi:glucokinase